MNTCILKAVEGIRRANPPDTNHGQVVMANKSTFVLTTPAGAVFHVRPDSKDCETVFSYWTPGKVTYGIEGFGISDGDTIIDVGAHIGVVSVRMATGSKDVKVYALEPFPENYALLKQNIRENSLEGTIIPHQLAVSHVSGRRELFTCTERADGHTFYPHKDFRFGRPIEVDCISLTEFVSREAIERVDFLKMDAEGAEYDVFLEGDLSFLNKVTRMAVESHPCHPEYGFGDIVAILKESGFQVVVRDGDLFARK